MFRALYRMTSFLIAICGVYGAPQSFLAKSMLILRLLRNKLCVESATGFVEQSAMISALLRLSPAVNRAVVECGAYKGGATVSLSLAANLVGRSLCVFDREFWDGRPPGLIGAGSGLGLSPMSDGSFGSCIGYAVKAPLSEVVSIELGKKKQYKSSVLRAEGALQ